MPQSRPPRLESLLELGLTDDASTAQIDEAFELATFVWSPSGLPVGSEARAHVELELERIRSAYYRLRPSVTARNAAAAPTHERTSSEGTQLTCPYCGSRLQPKRLTCIGARVRCLRRSCLQVFAIGENGPVRASNLEAVQLDLVTDQPFSTTDCDVFFEVEANAADLLSDFTIISARPHDWQTGSATITDDVGLHRQLEASGVVPLRAYKISADGSSTPSWATDLPNDAARSLAIGFDQTFIYIVTHGALAITTCRAPHTIVTLGRNRIRSRTKDHSDA